MAKHGHIHTRFNAHSKATLSPTHKGYKRCLPVKVGGGAATATGRYALRRAGARAGSLFWRRGRGSNRAGISGAATRGAHMSRSTAMGGPWRRAHSTRQTSFRRAATHRGGRGGIGQATSRL